MNRLRSADDGTGKLDLAVPLKERGIEAVIVRGEADLDSLTSDTHSHLPHLALLDLSCLSQAELGRCVRECSRLKLPTIALVPRERLADPDATVDVDDFVVSPPDADELVARARNALRRATPPEDSDVIRMGDLAINPTSYEVSVKGRRIDLRFKEYELLLLLASNPGRVYTREALLRRVWGYDYFGGTRTVDVHVRRLRSKLEAADRSLIETIWNVGYRFRDLRGSP